MRRTAIAFVLAAAAGLAAQPAGDDSDGVGFGGFGAFRIGMPLWDLLAALGDTATVEGVEGGCTHVYRAGSREVVFMVVDGALARVEVKSPALATRSGVVVGGTEDDVRAAYPGRVETTDHEYEEGHYLTVRSSDRRSALVFDTDGHRIRSFPRRASARSALDRGLLVALRANGDVSTRGRDRVSSSARRPMQPIVDFILELDKLKGSRARPVRSGSTGTRTRPSTAGRSRSSPPRSPTTRPSRSTSTG